MVDVGKPGFWDETHILNPATVSVSRKIFFVILQGAPMGFFKCRFQCNPIRFSMNMALPVAAT
jgi:hypothetical protein